MIIHRPNLHCVAISSQCIKTRLDATSKCDSRGRGGTFLVYMYEPKGHTWKEMVIPHKMNLRNAITECPQVTCVHVCVRACLICVTAGHERIGGRRGENEGGRTDGRSVARSRKWLFHAEMIACNN